MCAWEGVEIRGFFKRDRTIEGSKRPIAQLVPVFLAGSQRIAQEPDYISVEIVHPERQSPIFTL